MPLDLTPRPPAELQGELLASGAFVFALDLAADHTDGILEPALKEAP